MPFFSNDRIQELANQIAALRQQVSELQGALGQQTASQQQAIDDIRQTAANAVSTGLTETRAVVRQGLERIEQVVADPLTNTHTEIVAIRSGIQDLNRRVDTSQAELDHIGATLAAQHEPARLDQPEAEPVPEPEPQPEPNPVDEASHEADTGLANLLEAAAGISQATIRSHRDTWAFLVEHAAADKHFHLPADITTDGPTVEASISGPSLVAALTSLRAITANGADAGTRAIAKYLNDRLTRTIETIADRPRDNSNGQPVIIAIDDRLPQEPPTAPSEPPEEDQPSNPDDTP